MDADPHDLPHYTPPTVSLEDIKRILAALPPTDQEAVRELTDHFRRALDKAGPIVGGIAIILLNAEFLASRKATKPPKPTVGKLPPFSTPNT